MSTTKQGTRIATGFTVYDKHDQTTWPPGEGLDILVCYRNWCGEFTWTVTWSEYGHDHEYAALLDHGTDWMDLNVQNSSWVAWRLLSPSSDAPTEEAADALERFYVRPVADDELETR